MNPDDVLRLLDAAADPDPARVLEAVCRASGAERGFLVLREDGELRVLAARHLDGDEVARAREKVSTTLLERAIAEGRPVVASDADLAGVESLQEQKVRAVCAVPLRRCDGAVYLDHRYERGVFGDVAGLDEVAGRLDAALHAARSREGCGDLVGASKPMQDLFRLLARTARAPYPVLVCGESGTGKELVARELHRRSPRAVGPFVAANGAALPETLVEAELFGAAKGAFTGADRDRAGLFEQAHGGTLFLDEVGCLSSGAQESLLRALETGEIRRVGGTRAEKVDVRLVAATNEDLERAEGFRRDLYYRLNVLRLDLPSLRDHLEDLPVLVDRILARVARETGQARRRLSPAAAALLAAHRWPGNVRELVNALRRAASLSDAPLLDAPDFAFLRAPSSPLDSPHPFVSLDEYTRETLLRHQASMDLTEIADRLGVSRKTLWEKKKKWNL